MYEMKRCNLISQCFMPNALMNWNIIPARSNKLTCFLHAQSSKLRECDVPLFCDMGGSSELEVWRPVCLGSVVTDWFLVVSRPCFLSTINLFL